MGYSNIIDYVNIASIGNATDFGDLLAGNQYLTGCSNGTRGIFTGGYDGNHIDVIQYITIASAGNATDFGDLSVDVYGPSACSDGTKGCIGGGATETGGFQRVTNIDYVNITSIGNATDFGDLTLARTAIHASSGD